MRPSAVLESALYVTDLDAAAQFYAEVLGMEKILAEPGRHVFFRCGPGVVLLFNADATRVPPAPGTEHCRSGGEMVWREPDLTGR